MQKKKKKEAREGNEKDEGGSKGKSPYVPRFSKRVPDRQFQYSPKTSSDPHEEMASLNKKAENEGK